MAETEQTQHPEAPHGAHEKTDVDIGPLLKFAVGLTLLTVVSALLMAWLFSAFSESAKQADLPASPLAALRQPPPMPRLQVAPSVDMRALRAEEDAALHSYAWIVRESGLVRIPIERAMELTLQRGLPVRAQSPAPEGPKP